MALSLPPVPVQHDEFLSYVHAHPETAISDLVQPYLDQDAALRKVFAQDPSRLAAVKDNHVNVVPLYRTAGPTELGVRARDLATEAPEDKEKYLLPLREDQRKANGSPAVVPTLEEFQSNFALFTEGALGDLDWSNVVVAGSAVVTSLLPVPEKARKSKRGLRQYYHEEFAPASDVDLFLYGLTEEQAIDKIKHIEDKIRNTILYETTVVRTKNTITIVSQYPTRHVQIVLRIYHSVAEILTGFDVDCSTVAYDGKQVWASPRAIAAFITQTNQIDLTRRSPSYENRLSKYSHRGFEVFWSPLDRSRVDPTIFERSFTRTEGLARLLVLEKLPKSSDRDDYLQKRRNERGRPPVNMYLRRLGKQLRGNIKNDWEDEVPEWQEEDQVSDYHTLTIPYGRRFNARKIEKLLYTKDILLNAEWNRKKDREVHLHRHPAFVGDVDSVVGDCCGFCPQPVTDEEVKVAEEESKIYISGNVNFIKDDPGRQEIGSFNPITDTEWTEMAYVGRTEKLCQAIVSKDLGSIKEFLAHEDADPNRRDYTGRTPLQLACMSSSPEVVQCLVDHGARLISRMADGKTALHLAAARGDVEIIRILLNKSNENEEEEAKKQETLRKSTEAQKPNSPSEDDDKGKINDNTDGVSHTSASYVKVNKTDTEQDDDSNDDIEENQLEPDIYDINTVAWDSHATPLHLAILHCRVDAVKELVSSFGADILLPIKQINDFNKTPRAAILTLVLVLALPLDQALEMSRTLLQLGASPAQADLTQSTPLHYVAQTKYTELLDIYMEHDGPAVQRAINHLAINGTWRSATAATALIVALKAHNSVAATKLLEAGAKPAIERDEFIKASKTQTNETLNAGQLENLSNMISEQPIMHAVENDMPLLALDLLRRGADPNSEFKPTWQIGKSLLDAVRTCLLSLENFIKGVKPGTPMLGFGFRRPAKFSFEKDDEAYLADYEPGSYKRFAAQFLLEDAHKTSKSAEEDEEKKTQPGVAEKREAITRLFKEYKTLETEILARGAKTYTELHPDAQKPHHPPHKHTRNSNTQPFKVEFKFPLPTVTDATREAYLDLFEAAWNGDVDAIKARTLGMWGPSKDQDPLEIAIYDVQGLSCLSIAILRGHLEAAKVILQILRLQYKEKEPQGQKRFEINSEGDTDDGSSDDEGLNIVGQTVDDQFTHENVGESTNHVVSDICPLEALQRDIPVERFLDQDSGKLTPRYCPSDLADLNGYMNRSPGTHMLYGKPSNILAYAVYKNDVPLFEFLLKIGKDLVSRYPTQRSEFLTSPKTFQLAISLGRIECLSTLIRLTGSGLPLTKMSEDSGVEATKEPRHYPGLTIRGKKRADWANAGRQEQEPRSAQRPPLLIAAFQGNLASVEWFLGTGPSRCYLEYLESHKDDDNVHRIAQSNLGLEGTVLNWLHARNNRVLHCAVMSKPCEESERLVQYLVDHHPECLEVRSQNGHTPLALAFSLHRLSFARILIRAGANQAVRDSLANNLLHLLLLSLDSKVCTNPEELSPFIELLDQNLVPSMVLERAGEVSRTPFAHWIFSLPEHRPGAAHLLGSIPTNKVNMDTATAVAKILLELAEPTGQKHLEFFDGAGNTPVHEAVKKGFTQILKLMFDYRPDLLYRENSTGSTPLEMAAEAWVNLTTYGPPALSTVQHHNPRWQKAVSREPGHFVVDPDFPTKQEVMFRFCQEQAKQHPGKRILVGLFEANEVAKRLASTRMFWDYNQMAQYRWLRATEQEMDEITLWNRVAND
ncbi:uncharacterized protein N7459_000244 [Penicillium hispanicum]|uniref:uncharacterized protein n=1 Tax=Penicillium hispanicum TaxID=1080232 RepID=UPI002541AECC|nr:uncharacterized protein N7459_000244 [Penicillium hispanicum]KAJ5594036.1 hypothetical protein N7459_000244 [Penicillium hispanicum]